MATQSFETLAIKIPKSMAVEFELARKLIGMPSRAAYVWHLHLARRVGEMISEAEKSVLLELGHWGNIKFTDPTPDTRRLAQFTHIASTDDAFDALEKCLELLEMKGLVAAMPTPIHGKFANDVMARSGRRYRLTPQGVEAIRAMGYNPKLAA